MPTGRACTFADTGPKIVNDFKMHDMKKQFLFLLLSVPFFAISSCESSKKTTNATAPSPAMDIYNYRWTLMELNGSAVAGNKDNPAYLIFTAGNAARVAGFTGCNRLNGGLQLLENGGITFSQVAVTKMACLGENSEQAFLNALNKASKWSISNHQLLLSDGNQTLAIFNGTGAGNVKLNGSWTLSSIKGVAGSLDAVYTSKRPTIIFEFPGVEVKGNTSCNGYGAKVTVDGDNMKIENMISTMMACPGDGESIFVKAIQRVTRYQLVSEKELVLFAGSEELMRFTR